MNTPIQTVPSRFALALIVAVLTGMAVPSTQAGDSPTADDLKQVLTAKLKSLTPDGSTERNVVYQSVRAGAADGGDYPFQVTALIRDYGAGYPANRYYGKTCVSRFDKVEFHLRRDSYGDWQVQGALTPPSEGRECKDNPSAGVSSIPLSSISS